MVHFYYFLILICTLTIAYSTWRIKILNEKSNLVKENNSKNSHSEIKDKLNSINFELNKNQDELGKKTDKIISLQKENLSSDLSISIISAKFVSNYIDLNIEKYPNLKKLTFPLISIKLTNTGIPPIKHIEVFFDYFSPLSMNRTVDIYSNVNKLSKGISINFNSFPPIDMSDINFFRLKMTAVWIESYTQDQHKIEYYFEFSLHNGKLTCNPLDEISYLRRGFIFNKSRFILIEPKHFSTYKKSFIKKYY